MKKIKLPFLVFLFILPFVSEAQVNYSEHIAPIIQDNCMRCHRAGEIGPMPLTNYSEVSSWGAMIKYVTNIRYMPPWPPNSDYRHFINERVLSQDQIDMIGSWVDDGMPQGDPNLEPEPPAFPNGSQIGTPDVILEMAQSHNIQGNNVDDYQVFVIPTNFIEDKEIAAIEFRPGNTKAVHHVLVGYDVSGKAAIRDAQTPEYGYFSFGDFGINEAQFLSWGYVPGNIPLVYPKGIGEVIPAGADLLIQVHYAPLPTDETDRSTINVFFKDENDPIERHVLTGWVLPDNLPGGWQSFFIPANQEKTFIAEDFYESNSFIPGADYDVSLLGVLPHAHLLGKSYEIHTVAPNNERTNLIEIPQWDFNWQGSYSPEKMLKIPANSKWYTKATYDNTINNPANPNNPPQFMTWGEGTEDEMLVNLFFFVPYQPGDENISLGENQTTSIIEVNPNTKSALYAPSPNPANDHFKISFYLEEGEDLRFDLYNIEGKKIKSLSSLNKWIKGFHNIHIETSDMPSGVNFIRMVGKDYQLTQRIVIVD